MFHLSPKLRAAIVLSLLGLFLFGAGYKLATQGINVVPVEQAGEPIPSPFHP